MYWSFILSVIFYKICLYVYKYGFILPLRVQLMSIEKDIDQCTSVDRHWILFRDEEDDGLDIKKTEVIDGVD